MCGPSDAKRSQSARTMDESWRESWEIAEALLAAPAEAESESCRETAAIAGGSGEAGWVRIWTLVRAILAESEIERRHQNSSPAITQG